MRSAAILPTVKDRSLLLDVLRGVAVLGILLANIEAFSGPGFFPGTSELHPVPKQDRFLDTLLGVFVFGKFRSMLAILFGVGIWLQFSKRSRILGNWPGGYLKRTGFLALIGLLHGALIWYGDILFIYACVALVACLCVTLSDKVLWSFVWGGLALCLFCSVGLFGMTVLVEGFAQSGASFGGGAPDPAREIAAFRDGTYLDQVALRGQMFGLMAATAPFMLVFLLPLMAFGIILGRTGVLAKPAMYSDWVNKMLWFGLGIGLPVNLLFALAGAKGKAGMYSHLLEMITGPLLAVGYLALLVKLSQQGSFEKVARTIAPVGKLSLTVYLMQSVLATAVFYSWGLGYFASLSLQQELAVVLGIWVANLAFAHLWTRWFAIGPVEWLLRSLTEGRRIPWRYESYPARELEVPSAPPKPPPVFEL